MSRDLRAMAHSSRVLWGFSGNIESWSKRVPKDSGEKLSSFPLSPGYLNAPSLLGCWEPTCSSNQPTRRWPARRPSGKWITGNIVISNSKNYWDTRTHFRYASSNFIDIRDGEPLLCAGTCEKVQLRATSAQSFEIMDSVFRYCGLQVVPQWNCVS